MPFDALSDLPQDLGVGWLFPGQGAQHPGMGRDLYAESAAAREIFDRTDAALGISLSNICFEGTDDHLSEPPAPSCRHGGSLGPSSRGHDGWHDARWKR